MVLSYRFILVFINDRCRSLQSRMNRVVREMKKERSIFVGFYKRNSLIRQAVGKVFSRCSFLQSQMAFTFIGQTIRIKIRIRRTGPVSSYIPNESLRKRACSVCVISQMPLSDMPTPVSLLPQRFSHRHKIGTDIIRIGDWNQFSQPTVTPVGRTNGIYTVTGCVHACHHASPAGCRICCSSIGIIEKQSFRSQTVYIRSFIIVTSHHSQISPAQIICKNEHDIRFRQLRPWLLLSKCNQWRKRQRTK